MWVMTTSGQLPRCDICDEMLTEAFSLLMDHLHPKPPPPQVDPTLVVAVKLATAYVRDAHRQHLVGLQRGVKHWKRRRP
jgi:hypothetical protein